MVLRLSDYDIRHIKRKFIATKMGALRAVNRLVRAVSHATRAMQLRATAGYLSAFLARVVHHPHHEDPEPRSPWCVSNLEQHSVAERQEEQHLPDLNQSACVSL